MKGNESKASPVVFVHADVLSSWDQLLDFCHPVVLPGDLQTSTANTDRLRKAWQTFPVWVFSQEQKH